MNKPAKFITKYFLNAKIEFKRDSTITYVHVKVSITSRNVHRCYSLNFDRR